MSYFHIKQGRTLSKSTVFICIVHVIDEKMKRSLQQSLLFTFEHLFSFLFIFFMLPVATFSFHCVSSKFYSNNNKTFKGINQPSFRTFFSYFSYITISYRELDKGKNWNVKKSSSFLFSKLWTHEISPHTNKIFLSMSFSQSKRLCRGMVWSSVAWRYFPSYTFTLLPRDFFFYSELKSEEKISYALWHVPHFILIMMTFFTFFLFESSSIFYDCLHFIFFFLRLLTFQLLLWIHAKSEQTTAITEQNFVCSSSFRRRLMLTQVRRVYKLDKTEIRGGYWFRPHAHRYTYVS